MPRKVRTTVDWNGQRIKREILDELGNRLRRAAFETTRHARQNVSGVGKTSRLKFFLKRFTGGNYPKKRTGHFRRGITNEISRAELVARWGTNVEYGRFLQTGTRKMAARPWMSLTNRAMEKRIRQLLTAPMQGDTP